jgi:hypothetical protein
VGPEVTAFRSSSTDVRSAAAVFEIITGIAMLGLCGLALEHLRRKS